MLLSILTLKSRKFVFSRTQNFLSEDERQPLVRRERNDQVVLVYPPASFKDDRSYFWNSTSAIPPFP